MDFGNAPRTAPIGGPPAVARADIVATQGSVSVELPPEQTVQSAQAGEAVKLDLRTQERSARDLDARSRDLQGRADFERRSAEGQKQEQQDRRELGNSVEKRIVIEPRTGTVVLERKDRRTGETISQLPDETLLKLRIYSRELADRAQDVHDAARHEVERIA